MRSQKFIKNAIFKLCLKKSCTPDELNLCERPVIWVSIHFCYYILNEVFFRVPQCCDAWSLSLNISSFCSLCATYMSGSVLWDLSASCWLRQRYRVLAFENKARLPPSKTLVVEVYDLLQTELLESYSNSSVRQKYDDKLVIFGWLFQPEMTSWSSHHSYLHRTCHLELHGPKIHDCTGSA